jgi:adenosylcobinamide amidohydrolase
VVAGRGAQVLVRDHGTGAVGVDGLADALGELVGELGQACRHGRGQGGDLGIAEADQVVVGHAGEHRRPWCGREQRIGDEVVAATIDAAVKGVHDGAAPPHQSHSGG